MSDPRHSAKTKAKFVVISTSWSEKLAVDVAALTLQGPDISSSENLLDNKSLEQLTTADPQTVSHNTINGSSSTYPPEKLVAGAAESSSMLTLQEPNASSMDKFLDSLLEELITESPQMVLHNTINGSSSTSPSSRERLVGGAEKLAADVDALVSALTLQEPDISSSENLLVNKPLERLTTADPQTVSHNPPEKLLLTLQEPDASSMDKFLDSSLEESITGRPQTVIHNTINGSSSTSPSSCEKLVGGAVVSASAPILEGLDVSSSDVFLDSSSEESDSPRTVLHNIASASSSETSSLGSDILVRLTPKSLQLFYIRLDRRGYFWVYPYLGGPFKSIDDVDFSITLFDEVHRGDRNVIPNSGPDSSSSKIENDNCHLIQALLDKYNDDHNLCGSGALELEDLLKGQLFIENHRRYFHFNFTIKQKVDGKNLVFAEVSHIRGIKVLEVNCFSFMSNDDPGSHCYGCVNNGSPHMRHPDVNVYSGGRLNEEDGVFVEGMWESTSSSEE
ncbi:hypothetical protein PR202_gb17950 [Eleusine coracana subsp. coracana]|uniref:DUF3615 domain-containing protein n=1 Tax=Eleusine coracana subsp. coracana TaxID=191504 RepID=A0AAV5F5V2_ELECO|nr:hypothetical protein PR202_gb17950 [Eleusine coracana subsp. coracana]